MTKEISTALTVEILIYIINTILKLNYCQKFKNKIYYEFILQNDKKEAVSK